MASVEAIKNAIVKYLEKELMPKMEVGSVQKVITGVAISIALKRSEEWCKTIAANPTLVTFGIIDSDGNVDVDFLKEEIKAQIPSSGVVINLPVVGKLTFHESDIDDLYLYIMESEA